MATMYQVVGSAFCDTENGHEGEKAVCSSCKGEFITAGDSTDYAFCPHCGRRLDHDHRHAVDRRKELRYEIARRDTRPGWFHQVHFTSRDGWQLTSRINHVYPGRDKARHALEQLRYFQSIVGQVNRPDGYRLLYGKPGGPFVVAREVLAHPTTTR